MEQENRPGLPKEERSEEEELIALPDADEMMRRLKAINDSPHLVENLYPLLLREAGQQKYRSGIDLMVKLAIYDYVKDLPPVMSTLMGMQEKQIINALTKPSEKSS